MAQPRWGRTQTSPEPSHSGHTGCERQREKGLGLPPSPPVAKATVLLEMDAGEGRADCALWSSLSAGRWLLCLDPGQNQGLLVGVSLGEGQLS